MLYLSAIVVGQTNSDNRRRAGNTSKAYHTSYWNGFAYGIYEKLQNSVTKTEAQAETDAPGTALVLLDAKKQVEDFISKRHPRLKKNASSKTTSSSGFQAGMSDGKNADLYQRNRVKTNHKAISSLFFTVGRSVKTAFNAST
jgi:stalled ribosome rescue protein Dom34